MDTMTALRQKYMILDKHLDELALRISAAADAVAIGRGGVSLVARASGLSRNTIYAGMRDLQSEPPPATTKSSPQRRIRQPGAGRKPLAASDPSVSVALDRLIDPVTRGDPEQPLRWTCKSTSNLAKQLCSQGHRISQRSVWSLLDQLGYSMQSNRKTLEGNDHPDRDAQFHHLAEKVSSFQAANLPVISVDTKKKEILGRFRNGGREWQRKGEPEKVLVHDFADPEIGKAIPYGVYDITRNNGWVSVGVAHDTSEFAVQTIRRWWYEMGRAVYPQATDLLITADGGGSNGSRVRLWKVMLQRLADELGMAIHVCHFPPGTSKWNKIEHCLFSHITANWRGRPLESRAVVVNLIANTRTAKGLEIRADIDQTPYQAGVKVGDADMQAINIHRDEFHGEWNYRLNPRNCH